MSAGWKAEFPGKWLFNMNEVQQAGKSIVLRTDHFSKTAVVAGLDPFRDMHVLFELVLFTNQNDTQ